MSSSGIDPINSGPLIIRTYLNSSTNRTYLLQNEEIPISSNLVLTTSTNGLLIPSDNIYVSTFTTSSINVSTLNTSSIKVSNISSVEFITSSIVSSVISASTFIVSSILTSSVIASDITISTGLARVLNTSSINASSFITGIVSVSSLNASTTATDSLNISTVVSNNYESGNTSTIYLYTSLYGANNMTVSSLLDSTINSNNMNVSSFNGSTLQIDTLLPSSINGSTIVLNGSNVSSFQVCTLTTSSASINYVQLSSLVTSSATSQIIGFSSLRGSTIIVSSIQLSSLVGSSMTSNTGVISLFNTSSITGSTIQLSNGQVSSIVTSSIITNQLYYSSLSASTMNETSGFALTTSICTLNVSSAIVSSLTSKTVGISSLTTSTAIISTVLLSSLTASSLSSNTATLSSFQNSTMISNNAIISTLNISTFTLTNAVYSTLITSSMGIYNLTPVSNIDIPSGKMNISSVIQSSIISSSIYSTAGTYNITLPTNTGMLYFEMIGAGGFGGNPGFVAIGGTGGYIQGTINLPIGTTSIKVKVGASGIASISNPDAVPSGASYINIPTVGPLFVMAGAGGSAQFLGNIGLIAGNGGGGTFTSGVAPGGDGSCGSSGGSRTGLTTGGLGYTTSCVLAPAYNGASYAGNFEESLGGGSSVVGMAPGGSGYAGGGGNNEYGAGLGGGGSSYVNTTTTTISTSYAGNVVPAGVLTGYGRSGQAGYVSITFVSVTNTSLQANGDISCRSLNITSTISVPSTIISADGKILLGTGTPTYRFEINGSAYSTVFTSGYRYTSSNQQATPNPTTDSISLKTQYGIWASIFYATSDQRIKKDVKPVKEEEALQVVRQIKPVTYQYIDQINRHNQIEYGFIAQQVKSILPYAVKTETDFIPNIYDLAYFSTLTQSTTILTLRNKIITDIEKNDIIKIIDLMEYQQAYKVIDTGISTIVIDGNLESTIVQHPFMKRDNSKENTVFVYGKQVTDLQVLDKPAIFSVGIAAMKELEHTISNQKNIINQQSILIDELEEEIEKRIVSKNNL